MLLGLVVTYHNVSCEKCHSGGQSNNKSFVISMIMFITGFAQRSNRESAHYILYKYFR